MDIEQITEILNNVQADRSDYEFENFFLESYPTPAKKLLAVLQEVENIYAERLDLQAELVDTNKPGTKIKLRRSLKNLDHRYNQLISWLDTIDQEALASISADINAQEPEYWVNHLGRNAAIELLTLGRSSKATMDMMACLPVDAFEDAVRICVRYANLIKQTTETVEAKLSNEMGGLPYQGA
jgi:hypothetical protein